MTRKPPLNLVPPMVNLEQLERTLTEFAEHQAPMISRQGLARSKAEAEVSALESELSGLVARRELAKRAFEALMKAMSAEEQDITRAISIYSAGLTQHALEAAE